MKIYEKRYNKSKTQANRPSNYTGDDGGFFPYWNLSNGIIDLSRYQILDKVNYFITIVFIECHMYFILLNT